MSLDLETLYALLPAIYRIRDAEQGEPLKALLAVIAGQVAVLEEDLAQLYDDQFIETCAEWVVPYIGDLIGVRGLDELAGTTINELTRVALSQRAQVANTLAYRRRKGTAAVLEQLARDVTGWDANVVEFFQRLATTQHMNHLRPGNHYAPDLRQWEPLERLNTPFDTLAHTVNVRRIASRRGKHNIPNVGIFLWRLRPYPLTKSPAFQVDDRRYLFSPLGSNIQLSNLPETEDQITHLAAPINVAMPISRRVLDRDLETHYGRGKSLVLSVNGVDIDASQIVVCDLSNKNGDWAHQPKKKYGIDPVLGRIATPTEEPVPETVEVSFHYGFSSDIGGGEYGRVDSFTPDLQTVSQVPASHSLIQDALNELGTSSGVVEITDSGRYEVTPSIHIAAGKRVELRAADKHRPTLVLGDDLVISGADDAELTLNGLLISGGSLRVQASYELGGESRPNKLRRLRLRHCTLVPGLVPDMEGAPQHPDIPGLIVESAGTEVEIEHCIVGGLRVVEEARLEITNSIVDATAESNVVYAALDDESPGGPLHIENCTVIGKVHTRLMELASNTIFLARPAEGDTWLAPVRAERLQEGCVRLSYVPWDSQLPRRYYCQPASEDEAGRVRPQFTSLRYGDAGYCQLSQNCPIEIREGADDEAEMGAFHDLYQPQRETNLRVRLAEYLRFGLEAGIFYAT